MERRKTKMKMAKWLLSLVILAVSAMVLVAPVLADASGTSTGTATVTSAAPTISLTDCSLYDAAETADVNNTALVVNTEYHLNFTVSDANTMADLDNITIIAWDNKGQSVEDVDSQRYHYTWTYVNSTDTWACPLGAGYIDDGDCVDASDSPGSTSYTFKLAFLLSKVANYSNGGDYSGWQFNITVYDGAANMGTFGVGTGGVVQFGISQYLEISVTDTTHTWSAAPNTSDNAVSAGGDGKVDFTVIANRVWKVQVKSDRAALNTTEADTIDIGNVTQYGSDDAGSSVALTTNFADVTGLTGQTPPADEASPSAVAVYLWLDVPDAQPAGEYTYVLNIQVTV